MERVVAGVDFSEGSLVALRWAAGVARANGVPLLLVSAWEHPWWSFAPSPLGITPVPAAEDICSVLEQQLVELVGLEDLGDVVKSPPVVGEGGAAGVLLELLGANDFLVLGSRGHGATRDTLLGSVSTRCASLAPCPVAVVPTAAAAQRGSGPVVVGVDGSANALAAVRWAGACTDPDTEIVLAASWGVPIIIGQDGVGAGAELSMVLDSDRDRAAMAVKLAGDLLDEQGRRHRDEVRQAEARNLLSELAHTASMLVVGQRGRTGLAHMFLGSVTTSLVHHPECVVVVVRDS